MSTKPQPNMLIKLFPLLGEKSVNLRTELLAGLTTFLTMAYIIAINPSILSEAGMDAGALVTGTCLAAALGCFSWASSPTAIRPGQRHGTQRILRLQRRARL